MPEDAAEAPNEPAGELQRAPEPDGKSDGEVDGSALIRVGCADLPPGLRRNRYFERLPYLEVEGTMFKLPKASVLRRWADETGKRGGFGLLAPQVISHKPGPRGYRRGGEGLSQADLAQAGGFRATDLVRGAVEALARAAELVRAEVVLFRSPADFTPSASHRDALRHFFSEMAPADRFGDAVRVWEPQGLWEPSMAAPLAAELGVIYACDPISNDPIGDEPDLFARLPQQSAYFRISGLGRGNHRFDDYDLAELLEIVAAYERAWIVFGHPDKYPDSIKLHGLLSK